MHNLLVLLLCLHLYELQFPHFAYNIASLPLIPAYSKSSFLLFQRKNTKLHSEEKYG